MKKLLLAALPALALVAQGCGDSCTNKGAEARAGAASSCTVKAGAPVNISVTPACASCAEDAPKCDISLLSSGTTPQEQLDIQVRECDSNKGCSGASCSFGAVVCGFTPPNASGTVQVIYRQNGSTGTLTMTLDSGSSNQSCSI